MRTVRLALPLATLVACGSSPEPTMPPASSQQATDAPVQEAAPPDVHQLQLSSATVRLVTVKNGDTEVPASFQTMTGTVSLDLADLNRSTGELTLDLSSWQSGEELRDQRMLSTFFQVPDKPSAVTFSLQGISNPSGPLNDIGSTVTGTAKGKLDWRGLPLELLVPVSIQRSSADGFTVTTPQAFDVSIEALGMSAPLASLMELCEHKSIDDTVKVSLELTLSAPPSTPQEE